MTIMKKTYINPVMDVIEIKASHQLLAGSSLGMQMGEGDADPITADARYFDLDEDPDEDFDYDFDEEL